jgi:predicted secreted hydrolase
VTYWEGAVAGEGKSRGETVTAEGYVELTGYTGGLGRIF